MWILSHQTYFHMWLYLSSNDFVQGHCHCEKYSVYSFSVKLCFFPFLPFKILCVLYKIPSMLLNTINIFWSWLFAVYINTCPIWLLINLECAVNWKKNNPQVQESKMLHNRDKQNIRGDFHWTWPSGKWWDTVLVSHTVLLYLMASNVLWNHKIGSPFTPGNLPP